MASSTRIISASSSPRIFVVYIYIYIYIVSSPFLYCHLLFHLNLNQPLLTIEYPLKMKSITFALGVVLGSGLVNGNVIRRDDATSADAAKYVPYSPYVMAQIDKLHAKGFTGKGTKVALIGTGVGFPSFPFFLYFYFIFFRLYPSIFLFQLLILYLFRLIINIKHSAAVLAKAV